LYSGRYYVVFCGQSRKDEEKESKKCKYFMKIYSKKATATGSIS